MLGLAVVTDVSFIVQFLISLIGLGVAVDYSLLLVTRWREERAAGRDNDAAVREAMRTAGGAVVASGVTVAVSLLALVVLPAPFLRSIGYGGLLIPLISTLVTLTLLSALLSWVGPNDTGWADEATRVAVTARNPGRRWSTPADTAELVAWLVGDGAGWVTGQTIASDGGWSALG